MASLYSNVAWKDGMSLLPHHLQQLERSWESALRLRFEAENPLGWGLLDLELNEAAVLQGRLELVRCRAVFPDGATLDIPEVDPAPPARSFSLPPTAQSLDVFLTIPVSRPRALLVAARPDRADVRFVEALLEVTDVTEGGRTEPIDVAIKNLKLAISGEPLDGLVALRIAQIHRSANGTAVLRPDFIPPAVRLQGAPALRKLAGNMLGAVKARARTLTAECAAQERMESLDRTEMRRFLFLHTLDFYAPVLEHLISLPGTHPVRLFEEMLRLVGSLSTFAPGLDPGVPLVYQHDALTECFGALEGRLEKLLRVLFTTRYEIIPLQLQDGIWTGQIPEGPIRESREFVIAVAGRATDLALRFPNACKIAEADMIDRVVRSFLGAVPISHVPRPPQPIPMNPEAFYFQIHTDAPEWDRIRATGRIALYVANSLPGLQIELSGVRPGGAS